MIDLGDMQLRKSQRALNINKKIMCKKQMRDLKFELVRMEKIILGASRVRAHENEKNYVGSVNVPYYARNKFNRVPIQIPSIK